MASSTVYSEYCNKYLQKIIAKLSTANIAELAKKHKIIKRTRILDLNTMLELCIYGASDMDKLNLIDYACFIEEKTSKSICKQSVNQRFTKNTVAFAKDLFESVLSHHCNMPTLHKFDEKSENKLAPKFKKVVIIDSTGFELRGKFSDQFKGPNGSDCGSMLKIQYAFDLLSGSPSLFEITNGITPDSKYSSPKNIEKDTLYIQDLGYYSMTAFQKIQEGGGYFISKYNPCTNLYPDKNTTTEAINYEAIVAFTLAFQNAFIPKFCYLGAENRVPIRLVMLPLPEHIGQQRIDRFEKRRKKSTPACPKSLANCKVLTYITNVPEDILSDEQIAASYRLRWSIEIIFKSWKSIFNLEKLKDMSFHRFFTLFYFKLILFLIDFQVVTAITKIALRDNIHLSLFSCLNLFKKQYMARFNQYLLNNNFEQLKLLISQMTNKMLKLCKLNVKKAKDLSDSSSLTDVLFHVLF